MTRRLSKTFAAILAVGIGAGAVAPTAVLADASNTSAAVPGTRDAWVIMAGSSLKSTLDGWSRAAGWTLIWDSPVDYRVRASATFKHGFERAASDLIDSIYIGNPELQATFHRGNKVLHINNQPLSSN